MTCSPKSRICGWHQPELRSSAPLHMLLECNERRPFGRYWRDHSTVGIDNINR
jgi:hypothetical protein